MSAFPEEPTGEAEFVELLRARFQDEGGDDDARRPEEDWAPPAGFDPAGNQEGAAVPEPPTVVSLAAFAAVEEPGADALLGKSGEALIPQGGDVIVYGDGGAGKTTLSIDLALHLAAGDEWHGIPVRRPLRVLIVENEGPRPLFRAKLRRKLASWRGSPLGDRLLVVEAPWGEMTFGDPACREALAAAIREHEVDVVIAGPVTALGMDAAGTIPEVRAFASLLCVVRDRAGIPVAFVLVHHESKGGRVSGAWEGVGDTLVRVRGLGHGRTRVHVEKARWASAYQGMSLTLAWRAGEGFEVEEEPEVDEEALAAEIVAVIAGNPGASWGAVEKATKGVGRERRRAVRDGLFADGVIVNVVKRDGREVALSECPERTPARLYVAGDSALRALRPAPGADAAHGADGGNGTAPCAAPMSPGQRQAEVVGRLPGAVKPRARVLAVEERRQGVREFPQRMPVVDHLGEECSRERAGHRGHRPSSGSACRARSARLSSPVASAEGAAAAAPRPAPRAEDDRGGRDPGAPLVPGRPAVVPEGRARRLEAPRAPGRAALLTVPTAFQTSSFAGSYGYCLTY